MYMYNVSKVVLFYVFFMTVHLFFIIVLLFSVFVTRVMCDISLQNVYV